MANGYCEPILLHIEALSANNPAKKLPLLGMLQMALCCQDGSITPLNDRWAAGHERDMSVKFRTRPLITQVSDTPSACDTAITPAMQEFAIPGLSYREYAIYVPDSLIRQYCKDSSEYVKLNASGNAVMQKETSVMREVYDMLIEGGTAILRSIDRAIVTQAATAFGVNVVSGTTASTAVSFALGTTAMQDAMVKLITDWRENELCDDVCIVGNGAFANYDLIKNIMANGASSQGVDQAKLASMIPQVWYDKDTASIWGANQIGVFEKGSVSLLTRNLYQGSFARALGTSNFFSMALPVNEYSCNADCLDKLIFDVQVKEIDCPQSMLINGVETQVGPGVLIVLSKYFSLFTKPTTLYDAADPMYGTNGILRYTVTGT